MGGDRPLGSYVRELKCGFVYEKTRKLTDKQVSAIFKVCDQLLFIDFVEEIYNLDWPKIFRKETRLWKLRLGGPTITSTLTQAWAFSFWSLFNTVTATAPDIETIELYTRGFTDGQNMNILWLIREEPDTSGANTGSPCRYLKTVLVRESIWTVPYLEYLTFKAPNLVHASLTSSYEENLTKVQSTLEASLRVWSKTHREIKIEGETLWMGKPVSKLALISFPKMEELKYLRLGSIQISGASLGSLRSLESLCLSDISHKDVILALSDSSILPELTDLAVDWSSVKNCKAIEQKRENLSLSEEYNGKHKFWYRPLKWVLRW